ncbi:30S ribosomal protein S4 [Candidatus Woesearchaeota archaeon]|nr:30S ribosomal protein S4 [Candidatus Woesearchaeota archaeon]
MGTPRKLRKKYSTPVHPWNADVIESERELVKEYKLGNKKELWKMKSILKKYKDLAKQLIAVKTSQGEKEKEQMVDKLQRWGLIGAGAELDAVLGLEVKDILERRLQSLVFRKGLARSMKQARQFITHRHIMIDNKKLTFPSAIISSEDENKIRFDSRSSLDDPEHPERVILGRKDEMEVKAVVPAKEEVKAEKKPAKEAPAEKPAEEKKEETPTKEEVKK